MQNPPKSGLEIMKMCRNIFQGEESIRENNIFRGKECFPDKKLQVEGCKNQPSKPFTKQRLIVLL